MTVLKRQQRALAELRSAMEELVASSTSVDYAVGVIAEAIEELAEHIEDLSKIVEKEWRLQHGEDQ